MSEKIKRYRAVVDNKRGRINWIKSTDPRDWCSGEEVEKLEAKLQKRLTVSFVGRMPKKYDGGEGWQGCFDEKENQIILENDAPVSSLAHEIGHYVIKECGGGTPEHELYDYLTCENGETFIDFANKVETLEAENAELKAENIELKKGLEKWGKMISTFKNPLFEDQGE